MTTPIAQGLEFQVNTSEIGSQEDISVTNLVGGGFVVIYQNDNIISGQIYDAAAVKLGEEFQVSFTGTDWQERPDVAALPTGGFVATWDAQNYTGGPDIIVRSFNADGSTNGDEVTVNTYTNSWQWEPEVTVLSDGGYVVSWNSWGQNDSTDIFGQRFDADGTPAGSEFAINSFVTGIQQDSAITALSDGGFLVSWTSEWQDVSGSPDYGTYGQRFNADGSTAGDEFLINTTVDEPQAFPSVAAFDDGGFIVTWAGWIEDADKYEIYSQRYDADGVAVGGETLVNTNLEGRQIFPAVTTFADGGYVIVWQDEEGVQISSADSKYDIYGQAFNAAGEKLGDEFVINTYMDNDQIKVDIATLSDNEFIVTWESPTQDGVYGQVFSYNDINANNNPTLVNDDTILATQNVDVNNINVLDNDSDLDGDSLSIVGIPTSLGGTVTVNADNTLNFTPNIDEWGIQTITYIVGDGNGGLTEGEITLRINQTGNVIPIAVNDTATGFKNAEISIDVLVNDTDADGDTLSILGIPTADNGTVTRVDGITYTPNADFVGTDTIRYTISDGNGGYADGIVTVTVSDNPDNNAPVVVDDVVTTAQGVSLYNIDVLSNDTDADGDILSVYSASGYTTINNDGTINYNPSPAFYGVDTITYRITDGNGGFDTGTLSITVTASPDGPVAVNDTATGNQDTEIINIDVLSNDTDSNGDILNISGIPTAENGTVTVNADNTLNYTPNAGFNGTDTISYTVTDGSYEDIGEVVVTVNSGSSNNAPIAVDDVTSGNEDTAITNINVLGNDTDVDSDTLSILGTPTATNGSVTVNGDNTLNYTPNANFNGTDTITYVVSDGNGAQDTGEVVVTVASVNDAPDALDDTYVIEEGAETTFYVLNNDTDTDGDALSITGIPTASNGTISLSVDDTRIVYTPDAGFSGTDVISYTVSDGNGGTDTASVTVTVNAGANNAPIAVDDTASGNEESMISNIDVLSNDSDVDGDTLSITGTPTAANGIVTVNGDNTLNYTPNVDFFGTDTINYTVSDGNGGTDTGAVAVTVANVNDAPIAIDDTTSGEINTAINNIDVLSNDTDVDVDTLSISGEPTAINGSVTVNGDGTLNYTPNTDFSGDDIITYIVSDSNGGTDTGEVAVTVSPNTSPIAVDDTSSGDEDSAINNINVLGNDTDIDSDTLSISGTPTATNGSVTVNADNTLNYTPYANFNGTDTIGYTVIDGNGGEDTGEVTVTVASVNDAPVAGNNYSYGYEDSAITNINVLYNDYDADGDTLSISGIPTATNGSVTVNENNTLDYTPNANFNGTDTITYTVNDGNGETDTATVSVTVYANNDTPVTVNDTALGNEDTVISNIDVLGNDTDVDGDTLSISGTPTATNGVVTVNDDNTLNYTPNADFNGTDTISYTVSDGSWSGGTATGEVSVTVASVNDAPVAADDTASGDEDTAINNINVLGNDTDIDGDTLSISGTPTATNGSVTVNGDNTLNYTPNAGFNGTDTIVYTLSDGNGGTDSGEVVVTVNAAGNNAPIAVDDTASGNEDTAINNINVLGNDTDVDGDTLSISGTPTASNGSVTVNGDNTLNYTPNAGFNGTDTIVYTLSDGNGGTDTGEVSVTVVSVNDTPIAVDDTASGDQDTAISNINVLGNDTDDDNDTLSISGTPTATNGSVTVNNNGTLNYTPNAGFNGADIISYIVSDGNGGTDTGEVAVTVLVVTPTDDVTLSGGDAADDILVGGLGNDAISGRDGNDDLQGGGGADQIRGNEGDDIISGGDGEDFVSGNVGNDTLNGGDGRDTLKGNEGGDTLYGDGGDDSIFGNSGGDTLYGGIGNDKLRGNEGDDTLYGDAGNDQLRGNSGDDTLNGGAGNDYLLGADGADVLNGNEGDDRLEGGAGNDSFVFNANWGNDIVADFNVAGAETLDFSTIDAIYEIGQLSIDYGEEHTVITFGDDSITLKDTTALLQSDDFIFV